MYDTDQLLAEIESFLVRTGMAATTFGQKSIKNWKLVDRLRDGGSVTLRQAVRIREFIRSYRPAQAKRSRSGNAVAA
jgi:ribosomal protein L5